jgi:hypothetical protein
MAVFGLVLGTPPVFNVMEFVLLALHDLVEVARRTVLEIVVEATPELPLLAFAVMFVDVAVIIATMPVVVEVDA